ncbi:hypothetical protein AAVH_27409 [Aphelenchoides avenae]|nr:hypothetical protein AAVH_27409 [Aphelenchus avenae]
MEELPAGTTDDGLLEHCFGENAPRGKGKRTINADEMSASSGLFAKIIKASQTAKCANDVEIDMESSTPVPQNFPDDLQVQPTVTYWKNANAYRIKTTYSYSFADGRPRTVVAKLTYFHEDGKPSQRILQDPQIQWKGPPPGVMYKMLAGTSYTDKLVIRFTQ